MRRRTLLVSTAYLVSAAGCLGLGDSETDPSNAGGSDASETPTPDGDGDETSTQDERAEQLDERGTMEIVVDGTPIDLTADRFQAEHAHDHALAFHFHAGDEYWYMEGYERLTFGEAIDHIPHFAFDHDRGDHVVTYDGTVYDEGDTEIELVFLVDGEPVDPTAYELRGGDHLRLEITTGA